METGPNGPAQAFVYFCFQRPRHGLEWQTRALLSHCPRYEPRLPETASSLETNSRIPIPMAVLRNCGLLHSESLRNGVGDACVPAVALVILRKGLQ